MPNDSMVQELTYDQIIEKISALVKKNLPSKEAKLINEFILRYYVNVSVEDLNLRKIEDLYGAIVSHWNLMYQRKSGETKIKIFNPTEKQDGWQSRNTIIEVAIDDMPFLVDSLRMEIVHLGISIHFMIHLGGLRFERDNKGFITKILPIDSKLGEGNAEAPIYIEIDRQNDPAVLEDIRVKLLSVMNDVRRSVEDWNKMRIHMEEALTEIEASKAALDPMETLEAEQFIKWLLDDHFTFLGARDYNLKEENGETYLELVPGTGLGVLRDESRSLRTRKISSLPPAAQNLALSKQILVISKTNTKATVHRPVYTDYIGVKRFDKNGKPYAERRFIGLFTSTVYNTHPTQIPLINMKVKTVIANSKLSPSGHAGKELLDILTTLPRDDLFQASVEELTQLGINILHIQQRPRIRLFVRRDAYNRFVSCFVYVPREKFNTELRKEIQDVLVEAFHGTEVTFSPLFSESLLARVHYLIRLRPDAPMVDDIKAIEAKLIEKGRTWLDALHDELVDVYGEDKGVDYANKYMHAFPASYREDFNVSIAAKDILHMEKLTEQHPLEIIFYKPYEGESDKLRLKLFQLNQPIALSDVLPLLENMGLRVIEEHQHEIVVKQERIWINDYYLTYLQNASLDIQAVAPNFEDAFTKIWLGDVESDGFNRLVLGARLTSRETIILRAYAKYLKQIGFTFSQTYIESTLSKYPNIAKALIELFKLRFDPNSTIPFSEWEGSVAQTDIEANILKSLDAVANLDEDRILRRIYELIMATIRTNYFQTEADGSFKTRLSFKFNPLAISELPLPKPAFEVFVYSPRVEAIHLRTSHVARGGIRWSDRREDFRTEVLGLMKAQQVKNSVIVPSGAKGGFVVKYMPPESNREAVMEEVIFCYKTFMRGLLDITDNIQDGKIISPINVVRYDKDDPYLVVAADKGTASFSDIANGISAEYNFWLGDAFASGGSAGYDHKKMGITAKGAWESVKRHFRTLGIDPNKNDFTVVGIGDMSGDVFGNGMLLSHHIQLVAAFNHQHVFLDPNPDPEKSFQERDRLFNLPRSTWGDYNAELISKGGGVFNRSLKSIPLSAEVKERFGFKEDAMEPAKLIHALLKAEVDLLWNGGIGTYVKAKSETHTDVGDRANDAVRVDGRDLRCRAVSEGGNLGFTQLGRIEYALQGGLNYTDFIDNSAGVDCSDHEVNAKILLNGLVLSGEMTLKDRNHLLADMTDEVAQLVLQDNYCQTRAINLATSQSIRDFELYKHYLEYLEKSEKINRELERLPDERTLLERHTAGLTFTRPEIAILISYTKMLVKADLLKTDATEDPYLAEAVVTAFPEGLRKKYRSLMNKHSLHREIIATQLSNRMVNDMGFTFAYRMQNETSASIDAILRAYSVAREIFGLDALVQKIENLDVRVPADVAYQMIAKVTRLIRRAARWFLRSQTNYLQDISGTIKRFVDGIKEINGHLPELLTGNAKEDWQNILDILKRSGVSEDMATRIANVSAEYALLDVIDAAKSKNLSVKDFSAIYFALGDFLELDWLRDRITAQPATSYWELLARTTLRDDLDQQQHNLTLAIFKTGKSKNKPDELLKNWKKKEINYLERWHQLISNLHSTTNLEFIMFTVAERELVEMVKITEAG